MPLVPTRLLMINRQLDFAITVKRSLEQLGGFEVAPFTAADTALDYARTRPHDVAIVDFTLRGIAGVEIIARLREVQPDIAIIATPKNSETLAAMRDYALQEVIDTPMPVRQLIPILQRSVNQARETLLPDTAEAPSLADSQTLKILPPEFTPLDKVLESAGDLIEGIETIEVDMSDIESASDQVRRAISVFEQLAAEEPPMPGAEENPTLRDLRKSLMDTGERIVVELLSSNQALAEAQPLPPDDGEDEEVPSLARKILESALDHTSSLKALVEEVAPESPSVEVAAEMEAEVERHKQAQLEALDALPFEDAADEALETPSDSQIDSDESFSEAAVPDIDLSLPPMPSIPVLPSLSEDAPSDHPTEARAVERAVQPSHPQPHDTILDEARIAQMALDLTQASLESTAVATLLSRHGEVIAAAGSLASTDIEEIKTRLTGEWSSQSRIRFINLPGSGKDYMLFSRRTEEDLVLTMVFAGNMPLRVIRRQSDKLISALSAVPDATTAPNAEAQQAPQTAQQQDTGLPNALMMDNLVSVEMEQDLAYVQELAQGGADAPKALAPVYAGPRMDFTFIWMLRDTEQALSDSVSQAIIAGMDMYLTQQGWTIHTLRVHEDYIYLYGGVPGERPANEVIQELKQQSAQIVANKSRETEPATVWADAYFALMPGRELETQDIQRFIRFGRMAR